jgi:hypothetical protein
MAKKSISKGKLRRDTEWLLRSMEGTDLWKIRAIIDEALCDFPGAHNEPPATLREAYEAIERTEWAEIAAEDLVETRLNVFTQVQSLFEQFGVADPKHLPPARNLLWIVGVLETYGALLRMPDEKESWLETIARQCRQVRFSPAEADANALLLFFALGWKAQGFLKARDPREYERVRRDRSKGGFSRSKGSAAWWNHLIALVSGLQRKDPTLARDELLDLVMEHEAKAVEGRIIKKAHKRDTLSRKLGPHLPGARSTKSPIS